MKIWCVILFISYFKCLKASATPIRLSPNDIISSIMSSFKKDIGTVIRGSRSLDLVCVDDSSLTNLNYANFNKAIMNKSIYLNCFEPFERYCVLNDESNITLIASHDTLINHDTSAICSSSHRPICISDDNYSNYTLEDVDDIAFKINVTCSSAQKTICLIVSNLTLYSTKSTNITPKIGAVVVCPRLPYSMTYFMVAIVSIHVVIFVFGLIGNVLVIYVLIVRKRHKTLTSKFVLNLAVSDLLYLACLPFLITVEVTGYWSAGSTMCRVRFFI